MTNPDPDHETQTQTQTTTDNESESTDEDDGGVFVEGTPVNCPDCDGDLELQGEHGQMQCSETRDHQYTWASYEHPAGTIRHELVSGNTVHARTEVSA